MRKVLYLASSWIHIYNFHYPYLALFEDDGWEVHVAADDIPEDVPFACTHNIEISKKMLSVTNIKAVFLLLDLMKCECFDLIYVHTTLSAFLCRTALILSGLKNTRLVYLCHGYFFTLGSEKKVDRDPRSLFYLACEKLLAPCTSLLILMNTEDYESAKRYRLCKNIRYLHGMGLVPERYEHLSAEDANELRSRMKIARDHLVYLCVGEFSKRKNQRQAIKAFAAVWQHVPHSLLLLAGDGALMEDCRNMAKDLKIEDNVLFCGHTAKISELYAVSDVLISTSRSEGLPFCIVEGLHFGLPIIASSIKGHRDLIVHNVSGLLYNLDDDQQLVNDMLRLTSPAQRKILAERAVLPEEYYIDAVMNEFRALYAGFGAVKF